MSITIEQKSCFNLSTKLHPKPLISATANCAFVETFFNKVKQFLTVEIKGNLIAYSPFWLIQVKAEKKIMKI